MTAEGFKQTLLWEPEQGHCSRGGLSLTLADLLEADTGITKEFLTFTMEDREQWRKRVVKV